MDTLTPEEFAEKAKLIIAVEDARDDIEEKHIELDRLMENVLISLGYEEGVKLIRETGKWWA
jgi:hypothetical protein